MVVTICERFSFKGQPYAELCGNERFLDFLAQARRAARDATAEFAAFVEEVEAFQLEFPSCYHFEWSNQHKYKSLSENYDALKDFIAWASGRAPQDQSAGLAHFLRVVDAFLRQRKLAGTNTVAAPGASRTIDVTPQVTTMLVPPPAASPAPVTPERAPPPSTTASQRSATTQLVAPQPAAPASSARTLRAGAAPLLDVSTRDRAPVHVPPSSLTPPRKKPCLQQTRGPEVPCLLQTRGPPPPTRSAHTSTLASTAPASTTVSPTAGVRGASASRGSARHGTADLGRDLMDGINTYNGPNRARGHIDIDAELAERRAAKEAAEKAKERWAHLGSRDDDDEWNVDSSAADVERPNYVKPGTWWRPSNDVPPWDGPDSDTSDDVNGPQYAAHVDPGFEILGNGDAAKRRYYLNFMGLPLDTARRDLERRYKDLMRACHPDKHNNEPEKVRYYTNKACQVNAAYAYLCSCIRN